MARQYDVALLNAIKRGEYETEQEGVTVLVKPIPEGGADGDMDPRLYKASKLMPLMSKLMPKPKKDASLQEKLAPLRKMFNEYKGDILVDGGINTQHITVPSADGFAVPVRIYSRPDAGSGRPMLVYYHGGGFFGGGPDIVEQMCKVLVRELDCVVLNVDYRLCPEAHYPQPLDDCWAATCWAFKHAEEFGAVSAAKLAVAGDSAGGNLAAAITLRDREEGSGMVGLQVLLYPAVNIAARETEFYHGPQPEKYHKSKKHGKLLDLMFKMMGGMMGGDDNMLENVYLQGYLPPEHIYASPLLDDFHTLPPTLLAFGEHDFLVFEDFAYARHAARAGTVLKTIVYRGLGHGFADQIGVMPQAEDLMGEIARAMEEFL